MPDLDLVVRNALAVTSSDVVPCDIGVREGRVVLIGDALPKATREIDALGRYVTPGGVDAHCHLDQPHAAPIRMADDFATGTRSAACGGTTTIIPFAAQMKGQWLLEAVADYHVKADGKAHVDYAFHLIITDPTEEVVTEELPKLIDQGYTSFKIYMTDDDLKIDDRQIIELLDVARRHSAMPMVHAENAECIEWLTKKLESAGRTAPRWHAEARPVLAEREATHRIITYSQLVDVPPLIVHVSGKDVVEQIRWARSRGLRILAEICPQYLFLTAADLGIDDSYGGHDASAVHLRATRQVRKRSGTGWLTARSLYSRRITHPIVSWEKTESVPVARKSLSGTFLMESQVSRRGCRCFGRRASSSTASRPRNSSNSPQPIRPRLTGSIPRRVR